MRRELFDYELPPELVASRPTPDRDGARMMVLDPASIEATTTLAHAEVRDLADHLAPGSLLVVNDTRVLPARLFGTKQGSGGRVEILLVRRLGAGTVDHAGRALPAERWGALGRASKPLRIGAMIALARDATDASERTSLWARIDVRHEEGGVIEVSLFSPGDVPIVRAIEEIGHVPLPPYLHRADEEADRERYQTVFARVPGAVAAPTAGLHLSRAVLDRLEARGIEVASITLHVGLGTFQPVTALDFDDHVMHAETYEVPQLTAVAIESARRRGAPVVAVGTTVVRALESAADPSRPGCVLSSAGETRLLIQPGYAFRVVDALLTNFHLPQSTLLALVAAFAGRERVLAAYRAAVEARYRFFSYGDAMLVPARGAA